MIEMENNYLHGGEDKKRQDTQLLLRFNALPADNRAGAQRLVDELNAKDQELDDLFRNSCQSLDSEQCQAIRHDLQLALQSYEKNIPDTCVSFSQVYDGKRKIEKLISEHETAKAKVAHESYIKLIAENHAISLKTAGQLYNAMKVLHTGSAIAGAYYGLKTPNLSRVPKVSSKVAGVSDKLAAGSLLSKAELVAAKPPTASSAVLKQPLKVTNKAPCRVDQTTTAKSTRQLGTANKVTNFNVNDLINSAKKPINDQGLSVAARAWEKHAGRPGGIFKGLKGSSAQKNATANKFVQEVLNNKNKTCTNLSRGGIEYRLPDGRGIRYDADGSFSGFLDPKRPM